MIQKLSERKDLFHLLIKSVCPSIFGNELVKAGLVLSLFGGTDYRLKSKGDFADFLNLRDEKSHIAAEDEIDEDRS